MPVIANITIRHTFARLFVDVTAPGGPVGEVVFMRTENDQLMGTVTFRAGPEDIAPILMVPGAAGKSRADDIADACYELAIARGWLPGEIELAVEPAPQPEPEPEVPVQPEPVPAEPPAPEPETPAPEPEPIEPPVEPEPQPTEPAEPPVVEPAPVEPEAPAAPAEPSP